MPVFFGAQCKKAPKKILSLNIRNVSDSSYSNKIRGKNLESTKILRKSLGMVLDPNNIIKYKGFFLEPEFNY